LSTLPGGKPVPTFPEGIETRATPEPDDVGGGEALRERPVPGLTRDPANKNAREADLPILTQAETLHPQIRPFGHRVTLTTAPSEEETGPPMFSSIRGQARRMRALRRVWVEGQGLVLESASGTTTASLPPNGAQRRKRDRAPRLVARKPKQRGKRS
jgi:hypothetical protein